MISYLQEFLHSVTIIQSLKLHYGDSGIFKFGKVFIFRQVVYVAVCCESVLEVMIGGADVP